MADRMLVISESGQGKSSSIRNMRSSDTIIIKCFNKRLPFRDGDIKFKVYTPNNYEELIGAIVDIIEKDKNKKVKNIVIDDIIYFMSDEFMKTINVKGFEKFSNMASGLYGAFKDIPDLLLKDRPDILVTFLSAIPKYLSSTSFNDIYTCIFPVSS